MTHSGNFAFRQVQRDSRLFRLAWRFAAMLAIVAGTLFAQPTPSPEVSYSDDFQSYGTQKNPTGWIDTAVGTPKPTAAGLYKTWPDPLVGNQATNIVYGTKQSSGKPDGNNPRIGTFSTYSAKSFVGKGRFEYRGRFIRTGSDTRIGLTFFSSYPDKDSYYLIGLWAEPGSTTLTMQLFAFGGGAPAGMTDSKFTPEPDKWYHFLIQSDDVNNATAIRARFWLDGTPEPATFSIDAKDSSASRLTTGRIGMWSAVKGDAYVDDLAAKSPVDHTPPAIAFVNADTGDKLDAATLALFKVPARVQINVNDDLSTFTYTAKLDGTTDYTSGTPIAADGTHKITVHAVDAPGNASDATLNLLVDQQKPVVTPLANGDALADGTVFSTDVMLSATVTDTSQTKVTATLDGTAILLPFALSETTESKHAFDVTATDQVGWTTDVPKTFYVDKAPPVVSVFANNVPLGAGDFFQNDVTLTWSATDLTLNTVTATLDNVAVQSGVVVSASGMHTLVVTATDKANHTTPVTRTFPLDKNKPEVHLLANGVPFVSGTAFNAPVTFKVEVQDSTTYTSVVTIDGNPYTLDTLYSPEGHHTIQVVVTNAAQLTSDTGSLPFTIDVTPPQVSLIESGQPFQDGMKFSRDVNPLLTATDNLSTSPVLTLLVDGRPYQLGTAITQESTSHTIQGIAKDDAGNTKATDVFHFILDKTKPVVAITESASGKPFAADALFNHAVTIVATVADITGTTLQGTINGTPLAFGTPAPQPDGTVVFTSSPVPNDGAYSVSIVATDAVGLQNDPVTAAFTVDTTPPAITFTAPQNATLSSPTILVEGTSDDAVTVTVNGRAALIDATAKTFAITDVALTEGQNTIAVIATDKAGNIASSTLTVSLDSRAPDLVVSSPSAGSCVNGAAVQLTGSATDANLQDVKISFTPGGGDPVAATVAPDHTWTAALPIANDGTIVVTIVATDTVGHVATATVPVTIDRIRPSLEVTESGKPFAAAAFNHPVTLSIRAIDADPRTVVTATLNGNAYVGGTQIGEGRYDLHAFATDCAGNRSDETVVSFSVDVTAPQILTMTPAAGSTVGEVPSISGTASPDATTVLVDGTSISAPVANGAFSLGNLPLNEGPNSLVLVVRDAAQNESRFAYALTLKTKAPAVTILENGSPIPPNAIFTRPATPVIRSSDPAVTPVAQLNGAPFTSGTQITADNNYTLVATATDSFGHQSSATATFTIDATAPGVKITDPQSGATIKTDHVDVHGTATGGDVATVMVNGTAATIDAAGNFTATAVPLDLGPNTIIAIAKDRNGNTSRDVVDVTRNDAKAGLILTTPADNTLTNHTIIVVAGQLLTPASGVTVTINDVVTPVDATGLFRKSDVALTAGANTITAKSIAANGQINSAVVHVTGDFTPPVVKVTANDSDLSEGARFATSPTIAVSATDTNTVTTKITLDGNTATSPISALADGGHALTVIARDAAGNETRVDRSFVIGSADAQAGCSFTALDPPNNSGVYGDTIRVNGRMGAANVLVNGAKANVADGSFCAIVSSLQIGRNDIMLQCADSTGNPTGTATTLTLYRYTDTTVTITSPANGAVMTAATTTVSGTVGAGVVSGDVNGVPFTVPNDGAPSHPFSVDVPLSNGINILTARARTVSSRTAMTSVRVRLRSGAPQVAITSPLPGTQTGASSIDVTGAYANVDPSTIVLTARGSAVSVSVKPGSDTTGNFSATVGLAAGATTTIAVTAQNALAVQATASVDVQNIAGAPSITIATPADNKYYTSDTVKPDPITGTFSAAAGAVVQVNGVPATGTSAFSASIDFANASGATPVIARVTAPDGSSAADAIRVIKLAGPLSVKSSFPAANAVEVDPGAAVVVLFTNPLDATTVLASFHLADAGGQPLDGDIYVDNDAVTYAPVHPLTPGMTYTLTVAQSLKDLAGGALSAPYTLTFSAAGSAPTTAPQVDQTDSSGCYTKGMVTGHATVAGARMRLDIDGVTMTTTAAADASFRFDFSFSGQAGYHAARVRQLGGDGSLSPETDICFRVNCAGPQVLSASLDRAAKKLTIQFSKAMNASTLVASPTGTIQLAPAGGSAVTGDVLLSSSGDTATVTTTADLSAAVTLLVKKEVQDASGLTMAADYTQAFALSTPPPGGNGQGYVSGAVYDATNGRPLANAQIDIAVPINAFSHPGRAIASTSSSAARHLVPIAFATGSTMTDDRGRYSRGLDEGAYTIQASASGFTTVWRQIIVPAGSGVVPIDIRLTKRGVEQTATGSALTLTNGGDTAVTRAAELALTAGSLNVGQKAAVTSVGAQSLAGLLPLGWSPIAAAEITVDGSSIPKPLPASKLTFTLTTNDVTAMTAANQTLSLAHYDSDRDEWRVTNEVATIGSDRGASFDIASSGNYALVYPDNAATIPHPLPAHGGAALQSVPNPCTATPDVCRMTSRSFVLDPPSVMPNGRTTATLMTDGTKAYPSGTAVQAYIDEQLNLADGRILVDPPFATDLLIYRTPAGDAGQAVFHLAPTSQAAAVTLRDGVDHIRVVDYPGRIDRGALVGSEGGRVPGDDKVTIDIPSGATTDPLHASVTSISDFSAFPQIAGFHIAGGFTFSLTSASDTTTSTTAVVLTKSARATVTIPATTAQVIVVEFLPQTSYGKLVHLAALTTPGATAGTYTTKPVDATFPIDGIVRDGQYLVLTADNPIAFAYGQVVLGDNTPATGAKVTAGIGTPQANALGVVDLGRRGGTFALPVAAKPAAPFSLVPRTSSTGEGAPGVYTASPDANQIVNFGALQIAALAPKLTSITPADGTVLAANSPLVVIATFDAPMSADPVALNDVLTLMNVTTSTAVAGTVTAAANTITFTGAKPLDAGTQYAATLWPSARGANGAVYGRTTTVRFSTPAVPAGDNTIHPELISITIPDGNGVSTIAGRAGALPAGSIALAVKRGVAFVTQYQAMVVASTPFSITAGGGVDRITTNDAIDLQVIDGTSHAVIALIPLTPFVTTDGKGFIAPPDATVTFTNADNVAVTVPAGAFDQPTLVTLVKSSKDDISAVPHLDDELTFTAGIRLDFDGVAAKPFELEIPVPSGVDPTGRAFMLGLLGQSARGPRIMIADTLRIGEDGKFTTVIDPSVGSQSVQPPLSKASSNSKQRGALYIADAGTLTGQKMKQYLLRIERSGIYNVIDIRNTAGAVVWGVMDGLQSGYDLFWDTLNSLYAPEFYLTEKRGRIAIPVIANKQFQVIGVDASTGLTAFSKIYDPIAEPDPGAAAVLKSPNPDIQAPYPVFGTPFRVETVDIWVPNVDYHPIKNFLFNFSGSTVAIKPHPAEPLPDGVHIVVFNALQGVKQEATTPLPTTGFSIACAQGDRLVILVETTEVDPSTSLSLVFSEPIYVGTNPADDDAVDTYLSGIFSLSDLTTSFGGIFAPVQNVHYKVDSGGRRVLINTLALERDATYKLTITGLRDLPGNAIPVPLDLRFQVRAPGGLLNTFALYYDKGGIRDEALNGNVLFLAAIGEGAAGLYAYDTSDPASMTRDKSLLGFDTGLDTWAVASDRHNRVYSTTMGGLFGALHIYHLEDFIPDAPGTGPKVVNAIANATISWTPGAAINQGLDSDTILSDRPEAYPRKLQLLEEDHDATYTTLAAFKTAPHVISVTTTAVQDPFETFDVKIERTDDPAAPPLPPGVSGYITQRVTVENITSDMRWSADAKNGQPAQIKDVVAQTNDRLRIIWNDKTYGVVSLFGYGIGVYDLNAIESNDASPQPTNYKAMREVVRLTQGQYGSLCFPVPPVPAVPPNVQQYETLPQYAIKDLTWNPETAVITRPGTADLSVFGLDTHYGVLDLTIHPPTDALQANLPPDANGSYFDPASSYLCGERGENTYGLRFIVPVAPGTSLPPPPTPPPAHPRVQKLFSSYYNLTSAPKHFPAGRFTGISYYHWTLEAKDNKATGAPPNPKLPAPGARGSIAGQRVERDYMLVAGNELGVLVVEVGGTPPAAYPDYSPLDNQHLVDIIWIPSGAYSVRAIPRTNLATVVDGEGRVVLVDLTRIDERWKNDGTPIDTDALFPTVANCLSAPGSYGIGLEDPRIVWKSDPGMTGGTLAPPIDADTGFLYVGDMLTKNTHVIAAIDPRVQMKVELAQEGGLSEVGGVVPLGVKPPQAILDKIAAGDPSRKADASLAAFRLEMSLPGSIVDQLTSGGNKVRVAVESERVAGAITEQTPDVLPRAHLRQTTRGGNADARPVANFFFDRLVPPLQVYKLKRQKGYNKIVSPWIVAVADPRASVSYQWDKNLDKQKMGCFQCDRPNFLKDKTESQNVWELYTIGRLIAVRPDLCSGTNCSTNVFTGTSYDYLGKKDRLVARFSTIMADTVRPLDVVASAQNPPVAPGLLQETTYLHSGEVEVAHTDFDFDGRNGWNVVVGRDYRSRTIGGTAIGLGWDSPIFRRLRPLPSQNVEYRDGAGEIWLFTFDKTKGYVNPKGLFLKLARTPNGYRLVDQKGRITGFDNFGRLAYECDEFAPNPDAIDQGNIVRYLYDANGRLARMIDPAGRITELTYFPDEPATIKSGLVETFKDERSRLLDYDYDAIGRLTTVKMPAATNTDGIDRPTYTYTYAPTVPATPNSNDYLEVSTNLVSITDPSGAASSPAPATQERVKFTYGTGATRDKVTQQGWPATGETGMTFTYSDLTHVTVVDALNQTRIVTLTDVVANPGVPTISVAPDYASDRRHVAAIEEQNMQTATTAFGSLPIAVLPMMSPMPTGATLPTRKITYTNYNDDGLAGTVNVDGVRETTYSWPASSFVGLNAGGSTTTPLVGPGSAVNTTINYQTVSTGPDSFVQSVSANGKTIDIPDLVPNATSITATNDEVARKTELNAFGQPKHITTSGGTDTLHPSLPIASDTTIGYYTAAGLTPGPRWAIGKPSSVDETAASHTDITYPDANTTKVDDLNRNIHSVTRADDWDRAKDDATNGNVLALHDTYEYDATGRLKKQHHDQDGQTVTTEYFYDAVGRVVKTTIDKAMVGVLPQVLETTTTYDLASRTITRKLPAGATETTKLDGLGHVLSRTTTTGFSPDITEAYAYDTLGNQVYASDNHVATMYAYDAHSNLVQTLAQDGTITTASGYDGFGNPQQVEAKAGGSTIAKSTYSFRATGRLENATHETGATPLSTDFKWDGAGRRSVVAAGDRVAGWQFDVGGKLQSAVVAKGTSAATTEVYANVNGGGFDGDRLRTATVLEKGSGQQVNLGFNYDTVGHVTNQTVGSLQWTQKFDESGNLTRASVPLKNEAEFHHDSRGLVTIQKKPDGTELHFEHDAAGGAKAYRDPSEATTADTDLLGRPVVRYYPDSTKEIFDWDGTRLASYTDRRGRKVNYIYDIDTGRLHQVMPNGSGEPLEQYDYDTNNRLHVITTRDGATTFENYDVAGRPHLTKQTHYKDRTGFGAKTIVDEYTQTHDYNEHGEQTDWSLPYNGTASGWTTHVHALYDGAGNVKELDRTLAGSSTATQMMTADFRNTGRPIERDITTDCAGASACSSAPLNRTYGYEDNNAGQLNEMAVRSRGLLVAGTHVAYTGVQVHTATLLGLSGTHVSTFTYDAQSRLLTSSFADGATAPAATEQVNPSDFRTELSRPAGPADPPSLTFVPAPGHKIQKVIRGGVPTTFAYDSHLRSDDGHFLYTYDDRDRLVQATEKQSTTSTNTTIRRISYDYSPAGRIIGRTAEYAAVSDPLLPPTNWKLEDRSDVLDAEGLPARTTFVWDPMTDQLVAVFKAEATSTTDANGGLIRQIIHGGMGYDDPIEVTIADPGSGVPNRLYPIYDEAAAGSLQAVINANGEVVSRALMLGGYGEDEASLAGVAIDRIAVKAKTDASGSLSSVAVSIRGTEALNASTATNGGRLASITSDHQVVRTSTVTPAITDNTLTWTLTPAQWADLTSSAPATVGTTSLTPNMLSIAVTDQLRADGWSSSSSILPPTATAASGQPIYDRENTDGLPVEYEASLSEMAGIGSGVAASSESEKVLYDIENLAMLADPVAAAGLATPERLLVTASFHALPFFEPATGLAFARARWYDPTTGTFTSPDPLGYKDSSNLYAYCAGDPVNCKDPMGEKVRLRSRATLLQLRAREQREHPPTGGATYCNFAVQHAAGGGIGPYPHGPCRSSGFNMGLDAAAAQPLNTVANQIYDNLTNPHARGPWVEITPHEAQETAEEGGFSIGVQKKPGRHGHVAMIIPTSPDARKRATSAIPALQASGRVGRRSSAVGKGGPMIGNVGGVNVDLPASHAFGQPGVQRQTKPRYFTEIGTRAAVRLKKQTEFRELDNEPRTQSAGIFKTAWDYWFGADDDDDVKP